MKKVLLIAMALVMSTLQIGAKKQLCHEDFDAWNDVRVGALSDNGEWVNYRIFPQEGDAVVVVRNLKNGKEYRISRGDKAEFTKDSKWLIVKVAPTYKETREAKIAKKKGFDLPQDSLAILNLKSGYIEMIPRVLDYKHGEKGGEWIAWLSCDTALIKESALKDETCGRPLQIKHLPTGTSKTLYWVKDYVFSKDGSKLAVNTVHHKSDSTACDGLGVVMLPDTSYILLDRDKRFYSAPVFSEDGLKLSFTASDDSIKTGTKQAQLYLVNLDVSNPSPKEISVPDFGIKGPNLALPHATDPERQKELENQRAAILAQERKSKLFINQYSKPQFSHNGRRLVIGVAPYVAPDDTTIVDFERADIDIWRWDAPMTPPQEKSLLKQIRENQFPVVIDLDAESKILTTRELLADVKPGDRYDADWVLVMDPTEHNIEKQWNYNALKKLSIMNVNTGEIREVAEVPMEEGSLSPDGKYVVWYADRNFYVYDIASGTTVNVSSRLPYPIWNEEQDIPLPREKYEDPLWSAGDNDLVVVDRYDLWLLDPKGEREPVCMTNGYGRKNNLRLRPVKTDSEWRFFTPGEKVLLKVFDYGDKRNGLAMTAFGKKSDPSLKVLDENEYIWIRKAKDADSYAFIKANFNTMPEVYVSTGIDFAKAKKVSDLNAQLKDYSWGNAELVKWYAYNGQPLEGVLYTPEDFDPSKKYPMMVVFYETGSEYLYHHYKMEPSWSWINYPFYVSRGYVVFQPDVRYTSGVPGESAYNCVCSGVEEVCRMYPQIDKSKIGIDGQSWGGYQTAYLVTRTNMFACAGSGAPVANMTSAFGGIRWGTGDSRQAQYEVGQSRIGRNLWENKELYLANSPLFYADRVQTPLLIMHNDNDGAVPWYQGIELFMALRRLGKPVWMLQYNGEAHNLKERRNRKDITKRLQQFFDHYLKDEPMPKWMQEGIPAIRKGQELGF